MKQHWIRRALVCLCLLTALSGALSVPARAAAFSDVPAGHWAAEAVSRCVEQGWFQGKGAGEFGPELPMTRAAFSVVLSRFFGWQSAGASYRIFSDVPEDAWYEEALRACYEHGAFPRQTDEFRPDDPITREELAVTLIRALGYGPIAGLAGEDDLPFRDVVTNRGHIAMASAMGLVNGVGAGLFAPERPATRAQTAVILTRLEERLSRPAAEQMAIYTSGETLPDFSSCQTVILSDGRLLGGQNPRLESVMEDEVLSEALSAARQAGCRVLLGVSGPSGTLKAREAAAELLAQAVEDGGYDGLYLDISQPTGDNGQDLAALAAEVRAALPAGSRFYAAADAPLRGGVVPDYSLLAPQVDRVVLRVKPAEDFTGAVPVSAMEPEERLYEALSQLTGQVDPEKLAVLFTAEGRSLKGSSHRVHLLDGAAVAELEKAGSTYYSDRYACAYLLSGDSTVWYLNSRALTARQQLLTLFGIRALCLTTLSGTVSLPTQP